MRLNYASHSRLHSRRAGTFYVSFCRQQRLDVVRAGDWSAKCGGYNASKPADPAVQARMVQWLVARQAGVDAGRAAWCEAAVASGAAPPGLDCADGRAIHAAAGIHVYHASEVNLVLSSMTSGFPNNILEVVPKVALDMVTYSSYDTEGLSPGFGLALDFIAAHHNRTRASPDVGIVVAEYGKAQNDVPMETVMAVYQNVNAYAFSIGPSGKPRAMLTLAWELFDNGEVCSHLVSHGTSIRVVAVGGAPHAALWPITPLPI